MLKLGHIIYSNCYPPMPRSSRDRSPFPFKLVEGIPTELNRLLYDGKVDVSPSSSIEYAMNPGATFCCDPFDHLKEEGNEHSAGKQGADR